MNEFLSNCYNITKIEWLIRILLMTASAVTVATLNEEIVYFLLQIIEINILYGKVK